MQLQAQTSQASIKVEDCAGLYSKPSTDLISNHLLGSVDSDPTLGSGGMGRDIGGAMESEEGKGAAANGQHVVAEGSPLNSESSEGSSGQSEKEWLRCSLDSRLHCKHAPMIVSYAHVMLWLIDKLRAFWSSELGAAVPCATGVLSMLLSVRQQCYMRCMHV